jgi:hypothetical protein
MVVVLLRRRRLYKSVNVLVQLLIHCRRWRLHHLGLKIMLIVVLDVNGSRSRTSLLRWPFSSIQMIL